MFVFYNILDFIALERLQVIRLIVERGYSIYMPQLRLDNYGHPVPAQIEAIAKKGLIEIKEDKESVFEFVQQHHRQHKGAGNSLLALLHFCQAENAIIVIDDSETLAVSLAKKFDIQTSTLIEFYRDTLNDDKYLPFIMEMKKYATIK